MRRHGAAWRETRATSPEKSSKHHSLLTMRRHGAAWRETREKSPEKSSKHHSPLAMRRQGVLVSGLLAVLLCAACSAAQSRPSPASTPSLAIRLAPAVLIALPITVAAQAADRTVRTREHHSDAVNFDRGYPGGAPLPKNLRGASDVPEPVTEQSALVTDQKRSPQGTSPSQRGAPADTLLLPLPASHLPLPFQLLESEAVALWRRILKDKLWPVFEPNARVIIATIISVVGAALANAGGVGGGGLFVPMFNLFLGYDAKTSTALSKSMIFGGSLASVCFNLQLKHPTHDCSVIDFGVARLMQPMLLLGISIGVMCNVMFPPWIITALLCILLLLMTTKTLEKGIATRKKEVEARSAHDRHVRQHMLASDSAAASTGLEGAMGPKEALGSGAQANGPSEDGCAAAEAEEEAEAEVEDLIEMEGSVKDGQKILDRQKSMRKLEAERLEEAAREAAAEEAANQEPGQERAGGARAGAGAAAGGAQGEELATLQETQAGLTQPLLSPVQPQRHRAMRATRSMVQRCGMGQQSDVPFYVLVDWWAVGELFLVWLVYIIVQVAQFFTTKCSLQYWILSATQVPVSLIATYWGATKLMAEHEKRLRGEHRLGTYGTEEAQWTYKQVCRYPLYALLAGCMGGLLGIGGGMVMGPVLLEIGLPPQISSATSTFIVVFSSSLSVLEFFLLGRLPSEVAIYFWALAIFSAFLGLSIIRAYVIRSGNASIIIFLLGGVIGVSGLILGGLGSLRVYQDYITGVDLGFRSLCSNAW